jgi:hypothetical protein
MYLLVRVVDRGLLTAQGQARVIQLNLHHNHLISLIVYVSAPLCYKINRMYIVLVDSLGHRWVEISFFKNINSHFYHIK